METRSASQEATIPPLLAQQARALVDAGWFGSVNEIVVAAVRRFLDTHSEDLLEKAIRDDVEWGLHGHD